MDRSHSSVNAAAHAIGLTQRTLARIADGSTPHPRSDALQKLARYYETSTDWLLTGLGESPALLKADNRDLPWSELRRWAGLRSTQAAAAGGLPGLLSSLGSSGTGWSRRFLMRSRVRLRQRCTFIRRRARPIGWRWARGARLTFVIEERGAVAVRKHIIEDFELQRSSAGRPDYVDQYLRERVAEAMSRPNPLRFADSSNTRKRGKRKGAQ